MCLGHFTQFEKEEKEEREGMEGRGGEEKGKREERRGEDRRDAFWKIGKGVCPGGRTPLKKSLAGE